MSARWAIQQRLVRTRRRALGLLLASAVAALGTDEAWPAAHHRHLPSHLKHAQVHGSKKAEARHYKRGSKHGKRYVRLRQSKRHHMARAEVGALLKEYRGSYVMAFAGYNAGRGRVQEWVAKHGDPRDPTVDAVDWVERIPFAETRNYVQRVMENLQVYCARFGASTATVEPNLHRTAPVGSRANPILVEAIP